jgi:uncharacterized glyoxalase superfamily protein PhnB
MPKPRVVLDQLNIVVKDMGRAVDFYGRLGLEIPSTLPVWQAHHRTVEAPGGLDVDLDSASFASQWNEGWREGEAGVVIGFRVRSRDEVDALYGELTAAGYPGQQAPYDAFWGARYAVVQDPSGNAVGLMSPVDPDLRRPPPEPPGS